MEPVSTLSDLGISKKLWSEAQRLASIPAERFEEIVYRLVLGNSRCTVRVRAVKRNWLRQNKKGQTLVEYALILAFISVVVVAVIFALGIQVKHVFTTISSQIAVVGSSH